MKNINLKTIRIDGGTQSRVSLNETAVEEYTEVLRDGGELPPIVVFFDGSDNWLADGFHRFHAYGRDKRASIPADVRKGTRRDALLHAAGANQDHGLRRTNEDKRRAVQMLFSDAEAVKWSDRQIAKHCGVTHPFVASLRAPKAAQPTAKSDAGVVTVTTPAAAPAATATTKKAAASPAAAPAAPAPAPASNADDAYGDTDPVAEWEKAQHELAKAEEVIKAQSVDDTKAELAKQIRIRQGLEARLSDEMEKNKQLDKLNRGYGTWYAELRKITGLDERSAITRFVREAKNAKESAL